VSRAERKNVHYKLAFALVSKSQNKEGNAMKDPKKITRVTICSGEVRNVNKEPNASQEAVEAIMRCSMIFPKYRARGTRYYVTTQGFSGDTFLDWWICLYMKSSEIAKLRAEIRRAKIKVPIDVYPNSDSDDDE
jgi:hypothetical protein